MQIEHEWLATSTADPSTRIALVMAQKVDGTGRVWSPPIRLLAVRRVVTRPQRAADGQACAASVGGLMFNFGQTLPVKARRVVPHGRE